MASESGTREMNNLEWLPHVGGGSRFGWSWLSSWDKCETLWWNRNLRPHPSGSLGIELPGYKPALDIGIRTHTGLENWFRSGYVLDAALQSHRDKHGGDDGLLAGADQALVDSVATTDRLLRAYDAKYGLNGTHPDHPHKEIVSIEDELQLDVGYGGYMFTARLDLVWRYSGYIWALEHKTTNARQFNGLTARIDLDGQFTGQNMLLTEHFPNEHVGGVTADILLKDRGAQSKFPELLRKDTSRSPEQLEKFRLDVARKLDRIDNAVGNYRELLSKGVAHDDAATLTFDGSPDGTQCVNLLGYKCDFYDLCLNRRISSKLVETQFVPRQYKHTHENPLAAQLTVETTPPSPTAATQT